MFHRLKNISQGHWPLFFMGTFSSVANLFLPIVLVRLISPEEIGLYKTFFLYLMVLPFIALSGGPVNALYYWVGFDKKLRADYIKNSWLVTLMFSCIIFLIGFFILSFPPVFTLSLSTSQFLMLLVCGFLSAPSGFFGEVCVAKGQIVLGAVLGLSFELIKVAGFIWLAYKYREINIIFQFYMVLMILSFLFMTTLAALNNALTFRPDWDVIKKILRYSLPISMSSGIIFLIDKADMLILSGIILPDSFALYSLGCLIIPPLLLLEMSVQKILIPKISGHFLKQDLPALTQDYRKAVGDIAFLVVPAFFGLFFFSGPIIELLYTKEYLDAAIYLKIYAFSYLLLIIPHDSILRATGETGIILKYNVIMLVAGFSILFLSAIYFSPAVTLGLSILVKLIPKIYGVQASKNLIKARVTDLFPWKKLSEYLSLSVGLTLLSFLLKGLFSTDLMWATVMMPSFALVYISVFSLQSMARPVASTR
jgi:O-antigen/teichoic acid export membrane protein